MQSCFFYWPSDPEENLRRFPQKDGWFTKICSQVQDLFWISLEAHFSFFLGTLWTYILLLQRSFDDLSVCWFRKRRPLLLLNIIRSPFCLILLLHSIFLLLINHCWYQSKMGPINLEPKKNSHSYLVSRSKEALSWDFFVYQRRGIDVTQRL